jgi:hypothetical protein
MKQQRLRIVWRERHARKKSYRVAERHLKQKRFYLKSGFRTKTKEWFCEKKVVSFLREWSFELKIEIWWLLGYPEVSWKCRNFPPTFFEIICSHAFFEKKTYFSNPEKFWNFREKNTFFNMVFRIQNICGFVSWKFHNFSDFKNVDFFSRKVYEKGDRIFCQRKYLKFSGDLRIAQKLLDLNFQPKRITHVKKTPPSFHRTPLHPLRLCFSMHK